MTTEKLKELAEWALGYVRSALNDADPERGVMPQCVYEMPDGSFGIIAVPEYGNPDKKLSLRNVMRDQMKDDNAIAYVFHMEAWIGHTPGVLPSSEAKRKSAIVLTGNDLDGNTLFWRADIREVGTNIRLLAEPIDMQRDGWKQLVSSPLAEMLSKPKMPG